MALELRDFRGKITPRAFFVLEGIARTEGRDLSEVVRRILDEFADRQLRAVSIAERLAAVEGHALSDEGRPGSAPR